MSGLQTGCQLQTVFLPYYNCILFAGSAPLCGIRFRSASTAEYMSICVVYQRYKENNYLWRNVFWRAECNEYTPSKSAYKVAAHSANIILWKTNWLQIETYAAILNEYTRMSKKQKNVYDCGKSVDVSAGCGGEIISERLCTRRSSRFAGTGKSGVVSAEKAYWKMQHFAHI